MVKGVLVPCNAHGSMSHVPHLVPLDSLTQYVQYFVVVIVILTVSPITVMSTHSRFRQYIKSGPSIMGILVDT